MEDLAGAAVLTLILVAVGGYLLGSIPFGLVLTRLAGLGDIRQIGSGNIGATNVLRTGNRPLALATLLLDGGKGAVAVLLAYWLFDAPILAVIAGGAAFLGHCFPVWLGFKGGKGVATFLGTMIAIAWPVGLACCATWALVAAVMRISSLSALVAAGLAPAYALFLADTDRALLALFCAVLIFIRHRPNIERLLAGTEPRIGGKKE
ncbi:glycerol-3-phosphate 1-O-acyltransferase [Oleomonas cavernae]|uniref:Glycerol-3-phosphate acyltransferase n=1 Tax=Oleomonas cavernae TaxID=2320859 RepID=A0A418WB72_9PROT|nr:glycerol-3-phosphate 1-O-acyltransferase PlsY [Oleomonas cavernae]RJF87224.1 glycerol-3-phosphate 1-O-acyltransferase [Oleomonas cavernae]